MLIALHCIENDNCMPHYLVRNIGKYNDHLYETVRDLETVDLYDYYREGELVGLILADVIGIAELRDVTESFLA